MQYLFLSWYNLIHLQREAEAYRIQSYIKLPHDCWGSLRSRVETASNNNQFVQNKQWPEIAWLNLESHWAWVHLPIGYPREWVLQYFDYCQHIFHLSRGEGLWGRASSYCIFQLVLFSVPDFPKRIHLAKRWELQGSASRHHVSWFVLSWINCALEASWTLKKKSFCLHLE